MEEVLGELSLDDGSHLTAELPLKHVLVKLLWVSAVISRVLSLVVSAVTVYEKEAHLASLFNSLVGG